MTVYKCDRCGRIIEEPTELFGLKTAQQPSPFREKEVLMIMDICKYCFDSLVDWAEKNE